MGDDIFEKIGLGVVLGLLVIAVIAVFSLFVGMLVMYLWNWLLPDIFNISKIGYFQGVGISLLSGLLFGGWARITSK
jgi:hypothetical protein